MKLVTHSCKETQPNENSLPTYMAYPSHIFLKCLQSLVEYPFLPILMWMGCFPKIYICTKYINHCHQKFELNFEYISKKFTLSTPWSLEIYFMQIYAILASLWVIFTREKWATFVKFSTTTIIESYFLVVLETRF